MGCDVSESFDRQLGALTATLLTGTFLLPVHFIGASIVAEAFMEKRRS